MVNHHGLRVSRFNLHTFMAHLCRVVRWKAVTTVLAHHVAQWLPPVVKYTAWPFAAVLQGSLVSEAPVVVEHNHVFYCGYNRQAMVVVVPLCEQPVEAWRCKDMSDLTVVTTPRGTEVLVAHLGGAVSAYTPRGELLRQFGLVPLDNAYVCNITVTDTYEVLVSDENGNRIQVFRLADGMLLRTLECCNGPRNMAVFGTMVIATQPWDKTFDIIDLQTGSVLKEYHPGGRRGVMSVAIIDQTLFLGSTVSDDHPMVVTQVRLCDGKCLRHWSFNMQTSTLRLVKEDRTIATLQPGDVLRVQFHSRMLSTPTKTARPVYTSRKTRGHVVFSFH